MKAGLQMNRVMKLTLLCGLILMAGLPYRAALADEETHIGAPEKDRAALTKEIDEKVRSYTDLIKKIDGWSDTAVFSFEDGKFVTGKQLKARLRPSLAGLVEYRRLVQEFCWNEAEHTHIMEISKKLDEVVASLNASPSDAEVTVQDLKDASVKGVDLDGKADDDKVSIKKINADKLSELTELAKAVEVSFSRESENNVFKKLATWKGTGLNESVVSSVKRSQEKDDAKFGKDLLDMASFLKHRPSKSTKIEDEALKSSMQALADAEKDACVFTSVPKPEEPKKDEPKKEEPKKDEPKKDEPKKDEPAKGNEPKAAAPGSGSPLGLGAGLGAQPSVPVLPQVLPNTGAQQAIDDLAAQIAAEAERKRLEDDNRNDDIARAIQDLFDDIRDDQNDDDEQLAIPGQNGKAGKAAAAPPASSAPPTAPPVSSTPQALPQGGDQQPPFDPNQQIPPFQAPQFQPPQFGNNDGSNDSSLSSAAQQYRATPFNAPTENFTLLQQQQNQLQQQNSMLAQSEFQRRMMMGPAGAQGFSPYGPYSAGGYPYGQQPQTGTFASNIQSFVSAGGLQQRTQVPTTPTFRLGSGSVSVQSSTYGGRTSTIPSAVSARAATGRAAR
ncbi:MAG: hypothetical protein KDD51_00240 [Bdellovibrionales bacterium]|nr:hypothetical protein [Bdellovibrionales bacterium]